MSLRTPIVCSRPGDWQFEFEWKEIDGLTDDDSDDVPDLEGGSAAIYPENIHTVQDKPVKVYTPDIDDVNLLMGMGFTEPAVRVALCQTMGDVQAAVAKLCAKM